MKKIILLLLYIFASNVLASEAEKMMQIGNQYFQGKEYEQAIGVYSKLVDANYESAALFYNLGNAYFRTGRQGYAILYYEKALKLDAGDEDIKHNLAFVNSKTVDSIESFPQFFLFEWWEALLGALTLTGWTFTAYFFFIALLSSIGFYFFAKSPSQQKKYLIAGLISIILMLSCSALAVIKFNREVYLIKGIVVENTVTVKLSPDHKSGDAFIIHEGLKVKLEDTIDDWVKIRLPDGKVGWLQRNDLEII